MTTSIALLRGINVGKAKRIAMADLRQVFGDLGYTNVRTLLNSGNVVYDSSQKITPGRAAAIHRAIAEKTGVTANMMIISAAVLAAVVAENPLVSVITDPARFLVAFPAVPGDLKRAAELVKEDWASDRFALGSKAAYLWCASGILDSKLAKAFDKLMRDKVTARNWATVLKLHAMCQ